MSKSAVLAIIVMFSLFGMIEARSYLTLSRNYLRSFNKATLNFCTKEAHKQIQDDEIFNCFTDKNMTCDKLGNFSRFNEIRKECINKKQGEYGYGVIIALMFWIVFAFIGSI